MYRLYRQCLTAMFCLVSVFVMADTGRLYTPDKLSSGMITCISQDKYGYIWIGTEFGLNKFDGYRYTAYFHSHTDSLTISDNEVSVIFVDSKSRLWVGGARGLARYDYENDRFKPYHFPDNLSPRVTSMTESPEGDILIGTAGYGLFSIQQGSDYIRYEHAFIQRQADDYCSRIHIDRQGSLWRSSHLRDITRFTVKNKKPVTLRDYPSENGITRNFIEYSPQEMLVVGMYGIMSYHYKTGEMHETDFDLSILDGSASIKKAFMDSEGDIYIATTGEGLMVIPKGQRKLQRIENASANIDLSSANVVDVIEDKDHNLWVACYNKGLILMTKQKAAFHSMSFSSQRFVTGGNVASIVSGDNNDILCSVMNNGIYRINHEGRIVQHLASPARTRYIYRDKSGQYWLATENTLYRYNLQSQTATLEKVFASGRDLNCITDDGEGHLYISVFGMGLCIYNTHTGESQMLSMMQTQRSEGYLTNDWLKALLFDSRGMLWICTTDGVSMMNPKGNVFNSRGWNALLKNIQCYSICETANGDMLIGTESGLYRYYWKENKTKEDPKAQALKDKMICSMMRDDQGDIWISTTNGIWQYSDKRQELIGHVGGNGLLYKEYVIGSAQRLANGRIIFGAADGITSFYPQDINNRENQLGNVFLTRFFCNGRTINPMKEEYELRYAENTFTLEFSLLDYQNTDNISFQYRINGSDNWMQTNEGVNQITFTEVQPGHYFIEVRATSNGIFSKDVKQLHIIVCKPWYKSWWAYLLYAGIFFVILGLLLYNIDRQRRRDLEETKMRFLINATHDIRSPLTLIMGPLEKLKQRLSDQENQADINTIDKNAKRLMLLVNQILDGNKIDKQQMKLSCSKTNLVEFIMGIYKLYEYNAQQRNITFLFEHPDEPVYVWIDRIQFDKVISNLLSNAFKYTHDGGEIKVRLSQPAEKSVAVIEVTDNGIGFEDDKTEVFFNRFYQGKNSRDLHINGTGIGLNLCRALTEMHGGRITAANRKDGTTGAILTVQLPLGNKHLKPEQIESDEKTMRTKGLRNPKKQASRDFTILVVDDDPEIGAYIKHELGDWYRFDIALNGREALKLLLTKPFDLVITDVMMPEMDGITLLRSIKSNQLISDIPVILLTSKSEVSFRLEGLKKGADAFLAKPFSMEELHVQIDNLVDNVRRLKGKYVGAQKKEELVEDVEVKGNDDQLMERIIKCTNENLSNPDFDVEELAKTIGISRTHLHRKMKKMTGISASEFIRNIRLEQAARLIKEKKINISQVAYSVGFNNQTHFSTVFKRHFGMTPKAYLEQVTEDNKTTTDI